MNHVHGYLVDNVVDNVVDSVVDNVVLRGNGNGR